MLSIATIRRAGYFTEIASSDYYLEGGERPGTWLSVTGERAIAQGIVTKAALENLLAGWSRDKSKRLVKDHPQRQQGWDLTFSAPKSVSILYAIAPEPIRKTILEAHQTAIEVAIKYLVQEAILARRGARGKEFEKIKRVMVALFPHITSRAADPTLHTHLLLANSGERFDQSTGALWSRELFKHKMAGGAVYRTELAHQLQQRLGIILHRVRDWFEVVGIPKIVRKHFSKRSEEIRQIAKEFGMRSPQFLELVTKITQGIKGHLPHQVLHEQWRKRAAKFGITPVFLKVLLHRFRPQLSEAKATRVAAKAASQAIEKLTAKHSYFTERQIVQAASRGVMCKGGGADLLFQATVLATRQLIKLETPGLRYQHYTTPELYRAEKRILKLAQSYGRSEQHTTIPFSRLLKILDRKGPYGFESNKRLHRLDRLNLEAAVRHLVCSREQIRVVVGEPGSGKTAALKMAKAAYQEMGKQVLCVAPTVAGAKELRQTLGGDCITVHRLLDAVDPTYGRRLSHAAKQLWRVMRGRKTHRRGEKRLEQEQKIGHYFRNLQKILRLKLPTFAGKISLGKEVVVLLDQGEKLDTRTAQQLMNLLEKKKSPLRMAVATDAVASNGPGGAMLHVAETIGAHALKSEQPREREVWRQIAHQALRDSNPEEFLHQYRRTKSLTETATLRQAIAEIAKDWIKDKTDVKQKIVIASDPDELRKLNTAIQKARAKRFQVSLGGVKVPTGDKIRTGDRVRFAKNSLFLGVDAGDMGRVLNISRSIKNLNRKRLYVRVDEKKRFGFLPKIVVVDTKKYKHLTLGYAVLPSQADAKVHTAKILLNPERSTRESVLQQVTRAEKKTKLYCVKVDADQEVDLLLDSLARRQQKITAHQLEEKQQKRGSMAWSA